MSDKKDPSKSPRDTGGPVVKTGPTRGQNRSRNDDGRWRAKRSDAGSEKKKSGCYITSAACELKGLPDNCHQLTVLRNFRDSRLLRSVSGRRLVSQYYRTAPTIASSLSQRQLHRVWSVVERCVAAVESGQYARAVRAYRQMVEQLRR